MNADNRTDCAILGVVSTPKARGAEEPSLSLFAPICRLWSTSSSSSACSGVSGGPDWPVCVPGGEWAFGRPLLGVNSVRGARMAADVFIRYANDNFMKTPPR